MGSQLSSYLGNPIFIKLKILELFDLVYLHTAVFMYDYYYGDLYTYTVEFIFVSHSVGSRIDLLQVSLAF